MSTVISAGTTTNTAYNVNPDTSGTMALATGSSPTTAVYIDTSQNVGIGTTSPTQKLDVLGYGTIINPTDTGNNAQQTGLYFQTGTTYKAGIQGYRYNGSYEIGLDFFYAATGSGTYSLGMRMDSSGNVGIGVTSNSSYQLPNGAGTATTAPLVIGNSSFGAVVATTTDGTNNRRVGLFSDNTNSLVGISETTSSGYVPFVFRINGSENARIDTSGNLLVGGTSQIFSERLLALGTGSNVFTSYQNTNTSGYSSIRSFLQPNGNNTSTYHFLGGTSGTGSWYLYGNGTSSWSSDVRLKKNIETTRDGYIQDLCKLRVVKYNWKNDEEGTPKELGVIAQEVEQVFPGLVQDSIEPISKDDPTLYKQFKGSVLPFMLLKAVQELNATITAQATTITTMQAQIAALQAKVGA